MALSPPQIISTGGHFETIFEFDQAGIQPATSEHPARLTETIGQAGSNAPDIGIDFIDKLDHDKSALDGFL